MSIPAIIYLVCMGALLLASGFFSAMDMAYSCVNVRRLKRAAEKGKKSAVLAYRFAERYDRTITTILFGNNLVNILASSLGVALSMEPPFDAYPLASPVISAVLLLAVLTFGEILPKAMARAYSYHFCLLAAYPVRFFEIVFYPVSKSVTFLARWMTRPFLRKVEEVGPVSDEELQAMVDDIEDEGIIDESQSEIISNSIDFKDTCAYEVMTPRVKIEGISREENLERYVLRENAFRHSRIPVYSKSYDHIEGYIPVKSLQKAILNGKRLSIEELMLPVLNVPRTMEISAILKQMKKSHHHIAVVKDEYGGTEGIVTLEDILEELVGDMWDESEPISEDVTKTEKRNVFLVKGSMNITDFFERFNLDVDLLDRDYQTLSGWINDRLGRFGRVGDVIDFQRVTIRIKKVTSYTVSMTEVTYHPRRKI
ncbi:MAG: hemolysin family protein [Candidatus Enteromonas sp.]|nr:hemolysin family protein [Candidatus Enteromonas sp.]